MYWHKKNLERHFRKHPEQEECWEEFVGKAITLEEYEEHSYRTAERRCKVSFEQSRIEEARIEAGRAKLDIAETIQFVDGMLLTTILGRDSNAIKTHFHIHEDGDHSAGSTRWSMERQMNLLEDRLSAECRTGRIKSLKFIGFADSVPSERVQSLRVLEM